MTNEDSQLRSLHVKHLQCLHGGLERLVVLWRLLHHLAVVLRVRTKVLVELVAVCVLSIAPTVHLTACFLQKYS